MAKKTIKYLENGEYHDATVKDVGVIEELKTESKDNLVEAINEIFLGGGKGFSDLQQKVDESTQAAQNAQQATDNLQQRLEEVANAGLSDEEAQKIINQAVEDAKRAQAEALQAYKDAQKELDDSMAQFMEEQKAINKELEQAKTDIQGDIDQKNTEIEQINAVIESTKSDLTATSAQLASVRNDLTNAQMDWGKVRTEIANINGKLDSKMSNTDFDEYKERIEHNETEITQTKNELQSKATKQDLDVLTGTVTTQGSNIIQLAGKIEQKVSKDTLANDIDDFQVKKANIFTGTREFMGWEFSDKALGRVNDDIYNHAKVAEINSGAYLYITIDGLEVGKTYSVSIFAKASKATTGGVVLVADDGKSFNGVMKGIYAPHDTKVTTDWQRYYTTIVASATKMKFAFQRNNITSDTTLFLNRPKLEVGDKVYAWEDNAQDVYKRVEHTEAQFDVYNDQISGIVKRQTETDKKIENVSSTFTQRADGIEANSKKYTDDKATGLAEEFSGKLRATSEQLSTEYEKQTNAKIGALSDGGSNLILNSSFLITDNNGNATLENWRDTSSKISLTKPNGLDGTWIKVNRATTGTALGARSNYFPVKQGKLVVGVDVALDGTGNISPYVLRIEYYDVSNNRVSYEDITLQKLGLSASQITKSGSNFRYARGVYKTSNDRSDVAKACIVVPETITGYDMYLTNFFAKFSDVNDGTYEVNPLDQQASLIKQRTKIEQDSEKINLLNTQTEKLGNDIKATNTSVNVLKGEVDLKASQSTVNDLTSRVAKNEADIKVFPDKIKSEVSEVSKKVDGVNSKVDGIQVGGTNLMRNTTRDYVKFTGGGWGVDYLTPNHQAIDVAVEGGETYTFSAWVKNDSSSAGRIDLEIYQYNANGENKQNGSSSEVSVWASPGEEKRLVFTKTLLSDTTRIRLHTRNRDNNGTVTYWTKMAQVEKGTIATDWSPSLEDTDASIESVKTVATQTKDGFDRLTEKTGYNTSTGEFSKVTTQINEGIKGVSTQVSSVSNRLDNLSVGGTNLLRKTSNEWKTWTGTGWSNNTVDNGVIDLEPGSYVFRAEIDNTGNNLPIRAEAYIGNNSWLNSVSSSYKEKRVSANSKGYVEIAFTIDKRVENISFHSHAGTSTWNTTTTIRYRKEKLEKGTIATDWSPAPEDLQAGIDTATTKATQTDTKFERMISQIQYNNSTGEIGKYEHKITELANGTQEKISAIRTDSDKKLQSATQTLTNKIGDLESTVRTNTTNIGQYRQEMTNSANELSLKLTSYQNLVLNDISGMKNGIGGTNLVRNGAYNSNDTSHWTTNGKGRLYVLKHAYVKNSSVNHFGLENNTNNEMIIYSDWIDVQPNTSYTLSYYRYGYSSVSSGDTYIQFKHGDGATRWQGVENGYKFNPSYAEYKKFTFRTDGSDKQLQVRFDNNGGGTAMFAAIKLEKGTIATDWSPAPDDTDNKIGILQGQITANANKFNTVYTKTDIDNKINPLNSRTEFLQDNSKFLLRVQQAGGATQADVNSANSKIGDLSTRVKNTEVAITSGGVTINGNTTIDGTLNAKGMILDDKTGSKLEFTPNGLDISYSQNRNQYFTFSGKGLDFWKYTEAEGVQDYPYHHKPGYARLGNLTAWDGSYNDRTNYTARKNLDHPTNYNGMGFVIDITGGSDEFSIWQEGTSYRSDSGPIGQGQYWSLFNVNATGFGAARGRGIHHYTSNYFWSDQQRYNWQDDATLLGTIHDNGWKELELLSYRSIMAVRSDPRNSNVWVNGFIFGSQDGGERLFGFDGNQWIDVVNKRTTRDNDDYTHHFASMHMYEVKATNFIKESQLSKKTNIEKLDTRDFMSKVLSIDLYKYRYKTQANDEKDNYGAIIDNINEVKQYNLPQEFISTDDEGINTNNLITGLIATAQEQAKQIEDLTFRILEVERRNING